MLNKIFSVIIVHCLFSNEDNIVNKNALRVSSEYQDYGEEMGKLQRELTKCRMELSNRESNFNRMFTEKQPLLVDRRAGRLAFNGPDTPNLRYSRSKTFHNNVDPATRNETGSTINSNKTHTMKDTLQEIIDIVRRHLYTLW